MEYCEAYLMGKTRIRSNGLVTCKENCPYGNQKELNWELETVNICVSKGKKNLRLLRIPIKKRIIGLERYFSDLLYQLS